MFKEKERVFMFNTNCHELSINYSLITVSIMNKKAYQQPTMNVVKLQHKSHILTDSMNRVGGNADLHYGGGASVDANSRRGGDWDDWDEE
jgi:hypothetical protein